MSAALKSNPERTLAPVAQLNFAVYEPRHNVASINTDDSTLEADYANLFVLGAACRYVRPVALYLH